MKLLRLLPGLCGVLFLTSCLTDEGDTVSREAPALTESSSRKSADAGTEKPSLKEEAAPLTSLASSLSEKVKSSSSSSGGPTALNRAEIARLSDATRPHLPFFGATIYADQMDFNTGKASGDVFIDGTAMNSTNQEWPKYVYADEIQIDLANEIVILSGNPRMEWPQAHLRATSPLTTVYLSRQKYRVDGPAQYGLKFQ